MLVFFFSSTKLVLILFMVCVCCSWLFPNFSSGSSLLSFTSFLSFVVVSSVASLPISFFFLRLLHTNSHSVWFIQIVNPYGSYKLMIRKNYTDWQSIGTLWIVSSYTFNTQENKTQTTKLMATIAKRMWTPTTSIYELMKMKPRIKEKMREFEKRNKIRINEWCKPTNSQSVFHI